MEIKHTAAADMLKALKDVEMRTVQARLASDIAPKKNRTDFLLGELERIAAVASAAIAKAEGGKSHEKTS